MLEGFPSSLAFGSKYFPKGLSISFKSLLLNPKNFVGNLPKSAQIKFQCNSRSSPTWQGEQVSLRLPKTSEQVDASIDEDNVAMGSLLFADGSQKTLAGFTVWVALLIVWRSHKDSIQDGQVVQLISSLLVLPTIFKATEAVSGSLASTIGKIVKQNADSRVQPVSSLSWASILKAMQDEGGTITFDSAMEAYNNHPEVRALSDKSNENGSGSIALDKRRSSAVKNWLERTCEDAFKVVESSTHDIPFSMGAFGETMASYTFLFLGSSATGFSTNQNCGLVPLDNEPFMPLDWQLPMNNLGQTVLFERIQSTFEREKYRLNQENLLALRNLVCLFAQIFPHLETRLSPPETQKWLREFSTTAQRDEDIKCILESTPHSFALSMLPSSRVVAQQQAQEKEQSICLSVEKQRLDVIDAQWSYFKAGLERDQLLLQKIKDVPKKIATKIHQKKVKQMADQARAGEARVTLTKKQFEPQSNSHLVSTQPFLFDYWDLT